MLRFSRFTCHRFPERPKLQRHVSQQGGGKRFASTCEDFEAQSLANLSWAQATMRFKDDVWRGPASGRL